MAVFVAAVDSGSLAGAARRHGLSPSMAGKYVAAFEAELGVTLLRRTTRSLALTEAGIAFHARCQRILLEYERAQAEAGETGGSLAGPLRVSAPLLYGTTRLRRPFARFAGDHPEIALHVALEDAYVDLDRAEVDLAIRIGNLRDSDLVGRRLETCPMLLCGAPALVGGSADRDTPDWVRGLPRLVFSDAVSAGDWTVTGPGGRPEVIDGPVRMSANNMTVLAEAAAYGLGIAYGPAFSFNDHLAAGRLRPLLPAHQATDLVVQAIYARQGAHVRPPAKVRALIDHLVVSLGRGPQ